MADRRRKSGKKDSLGVTNRELGLPPHDLRALEKTMVDLHRLIDQQGHKSMEEMQAFVNELISKQEPLPQQEGETPLEKAQDLVYRAWDTSSRNSRVKLARQALEISPDCADAYVLLAEETARNVAEAKQLYEQGIQAGERALGPEEFKALEGDFWGVLETRPYMRARQGLVLCLIEMKEPGQAIDHLQDMLRLNPNDNQGLRYILVNLLLETGANKALRTLLNRYRKDGSAAWLYSRALLDFREKGGAALVTRRLKGAIEYNPFVAAFLLGRLRLPKWLPDFAGLGDEDEAVDYVMSAMHLWQQEPGALEWLRETFQRTEYDEEFPAPGWSKRKK